MEHAELLKEVRGLADTLELIGDYPMSIASLRTLADTVEQYHKSNAQLIAACNAILAGPEDDVDKTLGWAQGIIRAAPDERNPDGSQ